MLDFNNSLEMKELGPFTYKYKFIYSEKNPFGTIPSLLWGPEPRGEF